MPPAADPLPRLVLASASPRRAELLRTLGVRFDVRVADVDESVHDREVPAAYVERVARSKAAAIAAIGPDALVIAADTTVVLDGLILGKPTDADDARSMLRSLADRTHEVLTAVVATSDGATSSSVVSTAVTFAPITEAELDWYVTSGEPFDKAGAYGIQGAGGLFVARIDGSYHNVVGLPLDALAHAITELRLGATLLDWSGRPRPSALGDPPADRLLDTP
jgi:septum formation protein